MAKFELGKSVEAIKVNKRSGIPTTERVTIPFGAIMEDPREERDKIRFSYLGEIYDVLESEVRGAVKPIGAPEEIPPSAVPSASGGVRDSRFLQWDSIPSNLTVYRARIPGGWLAAVGDGVAFVPDPEHRWDGNSAPAPDASAEEPEQ